MKILLAEAAGTFGLLVAATGSIVYDGMLGGTLGIVFIAVMHFVGLAVLVFAFGRYSMAHFNPMVTLGFWITGHTSTSKVPVYLAAQAAGAFAGSLAVKHILGDYAGLGYNYPDYDLPMHVILASEVAASVFLMGSILLVVGSRRTPLVASLTIAAVVALDVYFFAHVSGASMNPIRSLAPAVVTGHLGDLWLYWSAPFAGTLAAVLFRKRFGHLVRPHA